MIPPVLVIIPPQFAFGKNYYPATTKINGNDWKELLTSGQYFVLRQGGTEPPFSSPLVDEKRRGVYVCAGCVAPLFDSTRKFESGTGWPSFAAPRVGAVEVVPKLGNLLKCSQCGGHLGDVFSDGRKFPGTPAEVTGKRYCIDGAALVFVPSDTDAGSVLGDGLTGRKRVLPM
jgi:peptide-methionine (R)-S-oxide reductase